LIGYGPHNVGPIEKFGNRTRILCCAAVSTIVAHNRAFANFFKRVRLSKLALKLADA
jgi:hypothetical protein